MRKRCGAIFVHSSILILLLAAFPAVGEDCSQGAVPPAVAPPSRPRGNSGYGAVVASELKAMWETPDVQRLYGRKPVVLIELTIAPDGRVKQKRIKKASGVPAMDESVRELLDKLEYVIPPNDGKECTLEMMLRIEE